MRLGELKELQKQQAAEAAEAARLAAIEEANRLPPQKQKQVDTLLRRFPELDEDDVRKLLTECKWHGGAAAKAAKVSPRL